MLKVETLPALNDNYIFLILDEDSKSACVIDPAVAPPVIEWLEKGQYKLEYILNTHHHWDHIGGNAELKKYFNCKVYCSEKDKHRIPTCDDTLKDGDILKWQKHSAQIMGAKGHTLGHILYYFKDHNILFCGDTLFALGCGYLFEGSPAQMYESLLKIKNLPDETAIYCTHEYTLKNAEFALSVDPHNEDLKERYKNIVRTRNQGLFTVPTSLKIEKLTNPFLRCDDHKIKKAINAEHLSGAETFSKLRELKNNF